MRTERLCCAPHHFGKISADLLTTIQKRYGTGSSAFVSANFVFVAFSFVFVAFGAFADFTTVSSSNFSA